jgi:hypothetical protein
VRVGVADSDEGGEGGASKGRSKPVDIFGELCECQGGRRGQYRRCDRGRPASDGGEEETNLYEAERARVIVVVVAGVSRR